MAVKKPLLSHRNSKVKITFMSSKSALVPSFKSKWFNFKQKFVTRKFIDDLYWFEELRQNCSCNFADKTFVLGSISYFLWRLIKPQVYVQKY